MSYNLKDILANCIEKFGADEYVFEKKDGRYISVSYAEFVGHVRGFAGFLQAEGLTGSRIAMYSENSCDYMIADAAIMAYVGISVSFSKEWKLYDLRNAAEMIKPAAILYSVSKQEVIGELKKEFPDIRYIPLEKARAASQPLLYENAVDPRECSKMIFSSGTTGIPKCVMLSQENMFANWASLIKRTPFDHTDASYLFLPLSHTYGGICNFLYSLICGMRIYLCSSTDKMMEELQEVKPTLFCAVPLIYERIYKACLESGASPVSLLGGNVRYLFSGGAPFSPEIRKFLKSAGLNLLEAYGLSETSSLISAEYSNSDDFTSAGTILENISAKVISPDENGIGEIAVKGGNVFLGYYGNEELTRASKDEDGYFRTGDMGRIDNGKLYITGRKKRVILLSNGENIYPEDIEKLICSFSGINKVKVFERDRKLIAAAFTSTKLDEAGLMAEINAKLPNYSRISEMELIPDEIGARIK